VNAYLGQQYFAMGDLKTAVGYLTPIVDDADEIDDEEAVASACAILGNISLWVSDFRRAIELMDRSIPFLERSKHVLEPLTLAAVAYAYGWTGNFARSFPVFERALAAPKAGGYPTMEASAHYWRACVCYFKGLWAEAVTGFERARPLAQKHNDGLLMLWNSIIEGYAMYMGGQQLDGMTLTRQALNQAQAFAAFPCLSIAYAFLAEPLCLQGQLDEANALAHKSLACGESGDNFGQLMAYRVLAMAAARSQPPDWRGAVENIETSIRLAGERGARPGRAIGCFRYAEILADMGKPMRAKEQLDEARQAFDDMGMVWWPEQVEKLAARLAGG
jgi:tetratricopeptide (TPR) repeat protein